MPISLMRNKPETREVLMSSRPRVLLLGDASFSRVHEVLQSFDIELVVLRGDVQLADLEGPYDLIVATVKATAALGEGLQISSLPGKPTWVAIHTQDFLPLRERLRALGAHYLIQSSVSARALRLLIVHTLYRGPERRREARLPVGSAVLCINGGDSFDAELLDLTRDGCRVAVARGLDASGKICVELPSKLAGGETLTLHGKVLRTEIAPDDSSLFVVVQFDHLPQRLLHRLGQLLAGQTIGCLVTRLGEAASKTARLDGKEARVQETVRKRLSRAAPEIRLGVFLPGGVQMAVGRDLSVRGVRLEPMPDLTKGRSFDLAVYGPAHDAPVLVQSTVSANDGRQGVLLRFEMLAPRERGQLEEIIETSPQIELLSD